MKTSPLQLFLRSNMVFLWLTLAVVVVLAVPFVAMQYTTEVKWGFTDFVIIGLLLFGAGISLILVGRSNMRYKLLLTICIIGLVIYIWAELAVGIFTNLGS